MQGDDFPVVQNRALCILEKEGSLIPLKNLVFPLAAAAPRLLAEAASALRTDFLLSLLSLSLAEAIQTCSPEGKEPGCGISKCSHH